MRVASDISDREYFDWMNAPGNKPGDDCNYPTVGDAWRACHQDLCIAGDWKDGIGHFFGVITRWLQSNPFGGE